MSVILNNYKNMFTVVNNMVNACHSSTNEAEPYVLKQF